METKMLEAISEMLTQDDTTQAQEFMVRAKCAKVMLDKIIEGCTGNEFHDTCHKYNMPHVHVDSEGTEAPDTQDNTHMTPKKPETSSENEEYFPLINDEDKTLTSIKMKVGDEVTMLPGDALVELDNVRMTHAEAKGNKFKILKVI